MSLFQETAGTFLDAPSAHNMACIGLGPTPPIPLLSFKVATLRLAAKDLLRSPIMSSGVQEGAHISPVCPRAMWQAVAPWLVHDVNRSPGDSNDQGSDIPAPCVARAKRVQASLEEAVDLKPELEVAKARNADLVSNVFVF